MNMKDKLKVFKKKKIIVTGFNGFKGTWLCIWLNMLGAKIYGISLEKLTIGTLGIIGSVGYYHHYFLKK